MALASPTPPTQGLNSPNPTHVPRASSSQGDRRLPLRQKSCSREPPAYISIFTLSNSPSRLTLGRSMLFKGCILLPYRLCLTSPPHSILNPAQGTEHNSSTLLFWWFASILSQVIHCLSENK